MLRCRCLDGTHACQAGSSAQKWLKENLIKASSNPYTIIRLSVLRIRQGHRGIIPRKATKCACLPRSSSLWQRTCGQCGARVATSAPANGMVEVGGPEKFHLDELVRQALAASKDPREVVNRPKGALLRYRGEREGARSRKRRELGETRFETWLTQPAAKAAAAPTSGSVKARQICVNRPHSNERFIYDDCKTSCDAGYLMSVPLETKEAKVTPLFSKDLTDFPWQGRSDDHGGISSGQLGPIHRHNAHAFAYVARGLHRDAGEGRKGSDADTLVRPSYEGPLMCTSSAKRKPKPNRRNRSVPGQGQRRSRIGAGELNQTTTRMRTPSHGSSAKKASRLTELWQDLTRP